MKRVFLVSALAAAALFDISGGEAVHAAGGTRPVREVAVTFRLQVHGLPDRHATFWVAYGLLANHFGLIRLRPAGNGRYMATARLPEAGRTVFAYLEGNGVAASRLGLVPGGPVVTIERVGPVFPSAMGLHLARWQAPLG